MRLSRNVSLATGLRYKGKGPMLTFVLHRIGGIGIATFVGIHMISSYFGGALGQAANAIYESWIFQLVIFFCALFHAVNGLRITLMDLWPQSLEHLREAIWVEFAVFIPLYAIAAYIIITNGMAG